MIYNLSATNLDISEADHIAGILSEYKTKIQYETLKSLSNGKLDEVEWFEEHLKWHEAVVAKIKWSSKDET